jgi:predicted permease
VRAVRRFLRRLWLSAPGRGDEARLQEEVRAHVDRQTDENRRAGMTPAEARRQAVLAFGPVEAIKEQYRDEQHLPLLDEFVQDVRYGLRLLRRSPTFSLVAVLSLALGIGANTAIFSIVDAVLLKPLRVLEPGRLVFVDSAGGRSEGKSGPPYPCYELLRDHSRQFSGLAMFGAPSDVLVEIDGARERVRGQFASGNYFDVLGVGAALGRTMHATDDVQVGSGGPDGPVVVISHTWWMQRFGGNQTAIGKRIDVDGKPMTIIGVAAADFRGLTVGAPVDLTVPVTVSSGARMMPRQQTWWLKVVGRLSEGASVDAARSELDGMFQRYMVDVGAGSQLRRKFDRIELVPAARGLSTLRSQLTAPLIVLMTVVGLVLTIGCANVASLLLARASGREDEMALRRAVGATRTRLVRQLLTEGAVLTGLGAVAGLAVAQWSVALLVRMLSATHQQLDALQRFVIDPRFDGRVLSFTLGVAVLTSLLCSLAPALSVTSAQVGVRGGSMSRSRRRWSQSLVVAQVTLSLMLLCTAALFLRTWHRLASVDAGFRSDGVIVVRVDSTELRQPTPPDPRTDVANGARIWSDVAANLARQPSVQSATVAALTPFSGSDQSVNVSIPDRPDLSENDRLVHMNYVTSGFFQTFGIPMRAGRRFDDADTATAKRVAILNETAARHYFGDASPLGRTITFNARSGEYEIVGVARDARYDTLRSGAEPMVYLPMAQALSRVREAIIAARTTNTIGTFVPVVQAEIRRTVPGGFAGNASTVEQQVASALIQERLLSVTASAFGILALTLACVGVYGLLSFSVTQRSREFGIRLAVGAQRREVVGLVLREIATLVGMAVVAGLIFVVLLGRLVESLLFEVRPTDPTAIAAAVVLLLLVTTIAAYLPARRASRTDVTHALRQQ